MHLELLSGQWKWHLWLKNIKRTLTLIEPILNDRLKEKFLKPWKGVLCIHFRVCLSVCVCVCTWATEHTFWHRNVIFGSSDPWDMRKKRIFLFFEIFIFTLFIGIFRFFPYITLVFFCFQATGHSFSCRNMIFGLREPCTIRNWRLLTFFENSIFYGYMGHFFDFLGFFPI